MGWGGDDVNEDHEILRRSFEVDGADEPVLRCTDALSALAGLLAERDRLRAVVEEQEKALAGIALELRAALDERDAARNAADQLAADRLKEGT